MRFEVINDFKKKSEYELISFINNRTSERIPNYSLLLGAGCSVTSGIKTGEQLVETWKKEYFKQIKKSDDYTEKELEEFLSKQSWYKKEHEYSSLFEKIYHLPIHRKKFIQQQVDKKIPSIGYAYLVSLCDENNKFFDTIYTTNFDDLINESFYQFGQERPILCAHDSSIKSLSVHTGRPKIIKLHGDYLYEVNATLGETDRLDENTEMKFREFSKEFGLVVIGYSGNDNSIMNCIEAILKEDKCFDNGVYWCVRKGEEISKRLSDLINNDKDNKIFIVEIDGFDQFMAKVNNEARQGKSILNNFSEKKRADIIESFCQDKYNLRDEQIIKDDISFLRQKNEKKALVEALTNLSKDSADDDISDAELNNLIEIDRLTKTDIDTAKAECKRYLEEDINDAFKERIINKLVRINMLLGRSYELEAATWCDELIKMDKYDEVLLIRKAYLFSDKVKTYETLMEEYDKFKNNVKYLNALSEILIDIISLKYSYKYNINDAKTYLEKSIRLNPSINNRAHYIMFNLMALEIENITQGKDKKGEVEKIRESAREKLKSFRINSESIQYMKLSIHKIINERTVDYADKILSSIIKLSEKSNQSIKESLETVFSGVFFDLHNYGGGEYRKLMEKYILSDYFGRDESIHITMMKLHYHINVCDNNKNEAQRIINEIVNSNKYHQYSEKIIDILLYAFANSDDAKVYIENVKDKISKPEYYLAISEIAQYEGEYGESIKLLDKAYNSGMVESQYKIRKSYIYLTAKDYKKVLEINLSDKNHEEYDISVLEINKQFALKKLGEPIDKTVLNEIIAKCKKNTKDETKSPLTEDRWICANIILGSSIQYRTHIDNNIKSYPKKYFDYKRWPILKNEKFKRPEVGLKVAS
ncbi:SIR2 family protein [Vibrio sagamiensis]|uniref:Uncharacterized protein n=1 Tax=Vibrio sagamiensis NBRC 104589 TaxID=1219064 RepID=A0A511QKG6_9VIBR|nr:SIR2 family protein [Vibrio sagamiensis]GEM77536.1 hypothetical protein VSA01S_36480 [Vibrio sagamiensis NBRC 104589]